MVIENDQLLLPPRDSQIPDILAELNEDSPERLERNLQLFREWINCHSYLPKNIAKHALTTFIRGSKHDLEKAKRKFTLLSMGKRGIPHLFADRDVTDPELMKTWNNYIILPLPKLTERGERITIFKLRNVDLDNFDSMMLHRISWIFIDYRINFDPMTTSDIFIFDCSVFSAAHSSKFLSVICKESIRLLQESFPFRIRSVQLINASPYLDALVAGIKVFLKDKLKRRFFVHQGSECLKKVVGEEVLPLEYGGKCGKIDNLDAEWKDHFARNNETLREWGNQKCTGVVPKNIENSYKFDDSIFGAQGSFRKLNLD
ncbi:PREDICTED: alpha-tocopherol transfer protein-like [Nicrophorus vespilloides]|uniref:Alpha-tocopherol transfer protein-like n=1 Tax=Nicrophorus vespilloides TaxID=110193 RepID=A0ABM1NEF8_NICVS|nr:PREDICTED: alpha-tocopherol transfer protein-like [Nicrophorus vespilloides]